MLAALLTEQTLPILFWLSSTLLTGVVGYLLFMAQRGRDFVVGALGALVSAGGLVVYQTANAYTGVGIDEAALFHLQLGWTGLTQQLLAPLLLLAGMVALAIGILGWVAWRGYRRRAALPLSDKRRSSAWMCLGVAGTLVLNPALLQAAAMGEAFINRDTYRKELLEAVVPFEHQQSTHTNPLSLVFIYAEGLERAFISDPQFFDLTPNLRQLAAEAIDISGVRQAPFTGWTIAGQAASQCGYPALHGQNTFETLLGKRAPCLTDILSQWGYRQTYMNGSNLEFAGKGSFWEAHGVARRLDGDAVKDLAGRPDAPSSDWGPFDDVLMDAAKAELDLLGQEKGPFSLTLLTLDTHAPHGHPTPSCNPRPAPGLSSEQRLRLAVACSDRLLGDFITHVREKMGDEVVIALVSDHLQPKSNALESALNSTAQRDNLVLFWIPGEEGRRIHRDASSFDLLPTLMTALKKPTQAAHLGRNLLDPTTPTLTEAMGKAGMDLRLRSVFIMDTDGQWAFEPESPQ